jgi:flagellar biosynthetic protein FliR
MPLLPMLPSAFLFPLLMLFVRTGAAMTLLPGFSALYVTMRIRLILALALALLLSPVLGDTVPPLPESPLSLALLILGEATVGIFIGVAARIILGALHTAGTLAAYFSSLASAVIQDPVADQQSSTIAGFFSTLGIVLVFATDLHHLMLRSILDSYAVFPIGGMPPMEDLSARMVALVAASFRLGLELAIPFLVAGLGYQVGLGVLGRLMPQLPVYFFGLPLHLGLQILVIALTISGIMMVFLNQYVIGLDGLLSP